MTAPAERLFDHLDEADDVLAAEVARRLGMTLPDECIPGIAANARLLQRHAAILRGDAT